MIELKHLTKKYDHFLAVEDLNLKIETGEFFGLLGPNGAGKTTTIGMLSTLLLPTSGEIWINGELLTRQKNQLKQKLSVVTQEYSMRQDMTMNEIMEYQGRLYYMPIKKIRERSEELLEFCGLIDYRKRTVRKLSGGMKRKLMVCRALLTEPEILLLDEPTAGMDAFARRQMWNLLKKLNQQKLTILLTTHYMEEAAGAGYVVILEKGSIAAEGTPLELKNKYVQDRISLYGVSEEEIKALNHTYKEIRDGYEIMVKNTQEATKLIVEHQELFRDYEVVKGAMDDVFLAVTGNRMGGVQE